MVCKSLNGYHIGKILNDFKRCVMEKSDSNVFHTFQALPIPHLTYTPFKLCFFEIYLIFLVYLFIFLFFFKKTAEIQFQFKLLKE